MTAKKEAGSGFLLFSLLSKNGGTELQVSLVIIHKYIRYSFKTFLNFTSALLGLTWLGLGREGLESPVELENEEERAINYITSVRSGFGK